MKILLIGKNGQLGKSLSTSISKIKKRHEYIFVGRDELDLSLASNISSYFEDKSFDIIINCAGFTAVDNAEKEIELANQINHLAVAQLAGIAKETNAKLIHISTDYVFDGKTDKPYLEGEQTNPINIYGKTKLAGERAIQDLLSLNGIIIRTSWVYSEYENNFLDTIIQRGLKSTELNIVDDQIGSPTFASDLADVIVKIINDKSYLENNNMTEIYHYSNEGTISWFEFAKEIIKIKKIDCKVKPISSDEYQTLAARPKNTSLNKDKIKRTFDINLISWRDSLIRCLKS
tara:strand:- start:402 stop:1268 length:867 start_codon:yes stop_codon:yes gene_type:complete